jgi:hypothetical protein
MFAAIAPRTGDGLGESVLDQQAAAQGQRGEERRTRGFSLRREASPYRDQLLLSSRRGLWY